MTNIFTLKSIYNLFNTHKTWRVIWKRFLFYEMSVRNKCKLLSSCVWVYFTLSLRALTQNPGTKSSATFLRPLKTSVSFYYIFLVSEESVSIN